MKLIPSKLRIQISAIPTLQKLAGDHLDPARSGSGAVSTERSIGINVAALDFSMAKETLAIMHGWESVIREGRRLTPPALVKAQPSTEAEVDATCEFHLAHLDWSLGQDWANDFADEVAMIHAKGMAATKQFAEQPRRVPCPTDECVKSIVIDAHRIHEFGLDEEVTCFGCKQSWSIIRLVTLAMTNPVKKFYLDVEAIATWLQITERQVRNIVKTHKVERLGSLYSISDIIKHR